MTNHKANEHTEGKAIDEINLILGKAKAIIWTSGNTKPLDMTYVTTLEQDKQALYTLLEREVIGEDEPEYLKDTFLRPAEARNNLRAKQRATLRKLLGVTK